MVRCSFQFQVKGKKIFIFQFIFRYLRWRCRRRGQKKKKTRESPPTSSETTATAASVSTATASTSIAATKETVTETKKPKVPAIVMKDGYQWATVVKVVKPLIIWKTADDSMRMYFKKKKHTHRKRSTCSPKCCDTTSFGKNLMKRRKSFEDEHLG